MKVLPIGSLFCSLEHKTLGYFVDCSKTAYLNIFWICLCSYSFLVDDIPFVLVALLSNTVVYFACAILHVFSLSDTFLISLCPGAVLGVFTGPVFLGMDGI